MQDRIIVDFNSLNAIANRLQTASNQLDAAMNRLGGLYLSREAGADSHVSCLYKLKTLHSGSSAFRVSSAVNSLKRSTGNVGDYSQRLSDAVRHAAELMEQTENQLSGRQLQTDAEQQSNGGAQSAWELIRAIIDHPYTVPWLLSLVSPVTGLLYITSGIAAGNFPSFINSDRKPMSEAWAEGPGYQVDDDKRGVTAWLGKAHAKAENQYASGEVNAYIGKAKAEANAEFHFMSSKKGREYAKDSKSGNYQWENESGRAYLYAELGAGAAISAVAADAKGSVGTDMLGAEIAAEGGLGNAKAEAKSKISIGDDGINFNASGEAMVSAAEGKVSGTVNILGLEITGSIGGYAGAVGVKGKFGIENNKWVMEGGVAALLGVEGGVEIGFNEQGWSNFVDFITFWD